ncbi:MAG: hypothetical protein Q4E48_11960 [Prevotella sp.]|nr:hypothetical protein [Prevotella sp.]
MLRTIIKNDFKNRKTLTFVNPRNGKRYSRHYGMMAQGGMTVINVGEFVDGNFNYAIVGINLSCRKYPPYVTIFCHNKAMHNVDMIADMVRQSINWALSENNISVMFEPCTAQIDWEKDFVHSYLKGMTDRPFNPMNDFGFEMLEEKFEAVGREVNNNRKSDDLMDYIRPGVNNKEKLVHWLVIQEKGKVTPKDIMRPVRFLQDKKMLYRPTMIAFNKVCHKEGLISVSSFNEYTNMAKDYFVNDEVYKGLVEQYSNAF